METCIRGFSFMPEINVDVVDLKYVESNALERTWKTTRRERLKQQEQKIWEEFVKEEDIVRNISQEDPYQFINQLPEECIKELLDVELQKMKQEIIEEIEADESEEADVPSEHDNQHVVTFVEDAEKECGMLDIFDDDKDDDVSGPEEELLNDSIGSPCTVRERQVEDEIEAPTSKHHSPDKISSKSSAENVTDLIESSIYSAKVKELIMKVNEELVNIIDFLERQDFCNIDPADVPKMMKRSGEFNSRFNRVHVYPLQRQLVELERHSRGPPLGRRVHALAQSTRVCSLLHNLLAAAQVFLKSVTQCVCMSAGDTLRTLTQLTVDAVRISSQVTKDLQNDGIQATCDKLNEILGEYTKNLSDYLSSIENTSSTSKKTNKLKGKKKSIGAWSKLGSKSYATEARLSMYSMDTRAGLNPKSSSSKDTSSGTFKMHVNITRDNVTEKEETSAKSPRKTPRNRPLMRAPTAARRRKPVREQDVHTLVETVPCTSNHISRDASPLSTPKSTKTPRRRQPTTPRTTMQNNKKSLNNTPRNNITNSPKIKSINIPRNIPKITKANSPKAIENIEFSRNSNDNAKDAMKFVNKTEIEDTKMNVKERDEHSDLNIDLEEKTRDGDTKEEKEKLEKDRNKVQQPGLASVEVTKLLRQLCGGDAAGGTNRRTTGAKNAQLFCVTGSSPRQPSTPQLLRILEETIQKKTPKALFPKTIKSVKDAEKYRMSFNIPERVTESLFQYRTRFVQNMLSSTMYANSAIEKPWEKIGSVSEQIIDELLLNCAKEMQLQHYVRNLYKSETC